MLYGAELSGFADARAHYMRKLAASAAMPTAAGKNHALAMLALSAVSRAVDPTYAVNMLPGTLRRCTSSPTEKGNHYQIAKDLLYP